MVKQKTKKYRGGLYGRGKKAGRGKGKRGGSGMAGLGKHRWIWMVKYMPDHYGAHGFVYHGAKKELKAINIGEIDRKYEYLLSSGIANMTGEKISIDLGKMGYDILLGAGQVGRPFHLKVAKATEKAIQKIKDAGGEVEVNGGDKEE